ncbi:TraR/DksA family transcriptional regulator [Methyloversatilis sp. MC4-4]|uniref:TraR/DksA family transcriptional regulator n=1 Tax=Methyloversatilis sp. MC4-4 TaxID=3132824 RepID=UPI003CFAABA1
MTPLRPEQVAALAEMRDVRALRDIELARERIDAGLAGVCVDCELPIPFERLRLQPAAVRCVECQEALERRSARQPDGSPTLQV